MACILQWNALQKRKMKRLVAWYDKYKQSFDVKIQGTEGPYAGIVNGLYIPIATHYGEGLVYKKEENSKIQIRYCEVLRSWKLVYDNGGLYTIAKMCCCMDHAPLEYAGNVYWKVAVSECDDVYELQPLVRTLFVV
jgi:hypothetical protein